MCVEIRTFFDRFECTITEHNIQLEDVQNIDKHRITLGVYINTRVLLSLNKKRVYVTALQNRKWVSIIEVVSTIGKKCRLVIIFKGISLLLSQFKEDVLDQVHTTLENGWTSNCISYSWLERIFLPEIEYKGRARLLLLDSHSSDVSIDPLQILKQNNVQPVWLPLYSLYMLQLLNLTSFLPTKSRYRA